LREQTEFINQILQDAKGKMEAKQIPLILQTQVYEYDGNDQFYSVIQAITDNLLIIKNMIQESFNINQSTIHEIMEAVRTKEGELNIFSLTRDRDIFLELMSQLEKNTAKQLQALMKKFIEERNETLESQLILARNTWRTVEIIKTEL
jgi:hypothetical protein